MGVTCYYRSWDLCSKKWLDQLRQTEMPYWDKHYVTVVNIFMRAAY